MTPEGRVKAMVKRRLDGLAVKHWRFMPVQTGYGAPALDFIICIHGWFVSIETKKDAKSKLTALQEATKSDMEAAGGIVLVIYDEASCDRAFKIIEGICINGAASRRNTEHPEAGQPQDQGTLEQHLQAEQQDKTVAEATGRDHGAPRKEPRRRPVPSEGGEDQRVTATVTRYRCLGWGYCVALTGVGSYCGHVGACRLANQKE